MEPNMLKKIEELIEVIREKEEFRIEIIVTKSNNKNANLEIKDLAYDSTKNKDIIKIYTPHKRNPHKKNILFLLFFII